MWTVDCNAWWERMDAEDEGVRLEFRPKILALRQTPYHMQGGEDLGTPKLLRNFSFIVICLARDALHPLNK